MEKLIITCIGDSLTEGDYGIFGKRCIANVHKENYPYFLEKLTGAKVNNFGHCGFRSSNILELFENGYHNVKDSNVIIILLGTNGGQTKEGSSVDDNAYRKLIKICQEQAPNAKIYLVTPPNATINPYYSNCGYMPQVLEAQAFVRLVAKEYNLPIIELAKHPLLTPENESIMQPNDGLHFGEEGYKVIANAIYDAIK